MTQNFLEGGHFKKGETLRNDLPLLVSKMERKILAILNSQDVALKLSAFSPKINSKT